MKSKVLELSKRLRSLHRRFLENERQEAEKFFERRLSAFDFLQILVQDKNFLWLQPLSAMIAEIDALIDESEQIYETDLSCIGNQVAFVLQNKNSNISARYEHYLNYDGEFILLNAALTKALTDLKT